MDTLRSGRARRERTSLLRRLGLWGLEISLNVESDTDLTSSSNSALPDQERHTERVVNRNGAREFLIIEHTANVRKNTKISAIWHHGGGRRRLDDHSMRGIDGAHTVKAVPQS
jgi:hypothetical protein